MATVLREALLAYITRVDRMVVRQGEARVNVAAAAWEHAHG